MIYQRRSTGKGDEYVVMEATSPSAPFYDISAPLSFMHACRVLEIMRRADEVALLTAEDISIAVDINNDNVQLRSKIALLEATISAHHQLPDGGVYDHYLADKEQEIRRLKDELVRQHDRISELTQMALEAEIKYKMLVAERGDDIPPVEHEHVNNDD